ncbi:MAG: DUF4956 domain-containing protein [Clostridia bacterium]|nr:DUF4956 domain-containing protein [Clostridia bacterium]
MEKLFTPIIDSELTAVTFIICSLFSLFLGFLLALSQLYKGKSTKSFSITVALLPLIVQVVIMLVNGNLGTGIAVAGAFSLVRFRSVPGSAKEILSIFMAMAVGLATGVGHIGVATCLTILLVSAVFLYSFFNFGDTTKTYRELKITVPENLNYTDAFSEVFEEFTALNSLKQVKTTNMGSLYKLTYNIKLKDSSKEREFIDKLRVLNGNLEISCNYSPTVTEEL